MTEEKPEADAPVVEKIRWIVQEVQRDCERDTAAREGQPLTGPNVAVWLGEISGTIAGLAQAVEMLLPPPGDGLIHGAALDGTVRCGATGQFASVFATVVSCPRCKEAMGL